MQKKFIVVTADTYQPLGVYQAAAPNVAAYLSDREVIHAEMSSNCDPTKPYLLRRPMGYYAVSYLEWIAYDAVEFGQRLMLRFAAENIALGITQRGMTAAVRLALEEVIECLITGSLYDAMDQVRAIPADKKDSIFVTDARLLQFINSIEDYLGRTRSSSL